MRAATESLQVHITKHPNYKYLSDYDERNTFDVEKFLSTKLKVVPSEVCDVYEIALEELA